MEVGPPTRPQVGPVIRHWDGEGGSISTGPKNNSDGCVRWKIEPAVYDVREAGDRYVNRIFTSTPHNRDFGNVDADGEVDQTPLSPRHSRCCGSPEMKAPVLQILPVFGHAGVVVAGAGSAGAVVTCIEATGALTLPVPGRCRCAPPPVLRSPELKPLVLPASSMPKFRRPSFDAPSFRSRFLSRFAARVEQSDASAHPS